MKRSTERVLTTHTGSLPRPDDLIRMMFAREEGVPVDPPALGARIRAAVAEIVGKQADAGIDVINDGEMSKPSYATYIKDRLSGFGGTSQPAPRTGISSTSPRWPSGCSAIPVVHDAGLPPATAPSACATRGRPGRRGESEGGARLRHGGGRLHERGLPGGHLALLPERALPEPREPTSSPSRTRCGTSTRPWPGPASCCRSTARTSPWAGTSSSPNSASTRSGRWRVCTSRR